MFDREGKDIGVFAATGMIKSVATYLPATVFCRGISFARGLIIAWLLASRTGQLGLLSVALQVINVVAPLASLGLGDAVTRYISKYEADGRLVRFLRQASGFVLGGTVCVSTILLIFSQPFAGYVFSTSSFSSGEVTRLAWATIGAIIGVVLYSMTVAILRGLRSFEALALMELTHGVLFVILSIGAVLFVSRRAEAVIWAYLGALLIPTLAWGWLMAGRLAGRSRQESSIETRQVARQILRFGIWTALAGVGWQGWQACSLWYLTKFDTALHSDVFAAARIIGQAIIIVGMSLIAIIMTNVYVHWEIGARIRANFLLGVYTKLALLGLLIACLVIVLFRNSIMIVLPASLAGASAIMPQMVLFFFYGTAMTFLAVNVALIEKMHLVLWSWLCGLLANGFLVWLWVGGPASLAWAANAAVWSCVPALALLIVMIRRQGQPVTTGIMVILGLSLLILIPNSMVASVLATCLLGLGWATGVLFDQQERTFIVETVSRCVSQKTRLDGGE
jgi:O-antigen/teichoic acid export membrane protein